jgi:glycerol uptake facilitator-like aquaporin
MKLSRALACEFVGTAFLVATVVGSGTLAHKLDAGNIAVSVSSVAIATGCVLVALILSLGSISCQLNPIVTLSSAIRRELPWSSVAPYVVAQMLGGIVGTIAANLMFDLPAITFSTTTRSGTGLWLGEIIATFGLLGVIFGCGRANPTAVPIAVGCYVAGAIWFTSSTCFANPAVTIARVFTDTLTGIRSADVIPYIVAQLCGATAALTFFGWLYAQPKTRNLELELQARIAEFNETELARK